MPLRTPEGGVASETERASFPAGLSRNDETTTTHTFFERDLELATLCHQEFDGSLFDAVPRARLHELPSDAVTAFVDPRASGDAQLRSALNDAGAPFGTVHEAVASIRAQRAASARCWATGTRTRLAQSRNRSCGARPCRPTANSLTP